MPFLIDTGFAPEVTLNIPNFMISLARTDAVVVPSPAESFVLLATFDLADISAYESCGEWVCHMQEMYTIWFIHGSKQQGKANAGWENDAYFTNQWGTSILHGISELNSTSNGNSIIDHFGGSKLIQDNIPSCECKRKVNLAAATLDSRAQLSILAACLYSGIYFGSIV